MTVMYAGSAPSDFIGAKASPLLEASMVMVQNMPVPDEALGQAALSVALQAVCRAASDGLAVTNLDVISAFASAFVSSVFADADCREVQDGVVQHLGDAIQRTLASHRAAHPCRGIG